MGLREHCIGLLARLSERFLGLFEANLSGYLSLTQVTLGGLPLGLSSEPSTLERRVRFHAAALHQSACLRFAVRDRALTG